MQIGFSKEALQDIDDISLYSLIEWGRTKETEYIKKLDHAFEIIMITPHIGYTHEELSNLYRCYPVGSHIIVYQINDEVIYIARILHQRMDVTENIGE